MLAESMGRVEEAYNTRGMEHRAAALRTGPLTANSTEASGDKHGIHVRNLVDSVFTPLEPCANNARDLAQFAEREKTARTWERNIRGLATVLSVLTPAPWPYEFTVPTTRMFSRYKLAQEAHSSMQTSQEGLPALLLANPPPTTADADSDSGTTSEDTL